MKYKKLIKRLREIAKIFKVSVSFEKIKVFDVGGYADVHNRYIKVYYDNCFDSKWLINCFFHELGHMIDFSDKKFINFYKKRTSLKIKRRLCWKAERHADLTGKIFSLCYFPKHKYQKAYTTKEDKAWLKKFYE